MDRHASPPRPPSRARKIVGARAGSVARHVLRSSGKRSPRRQAKQISESRASVAGRLGARRAFGRGHRPSPCRVESVAPGRCIIESEFGIVDAQLDTQLRVIERPALWEGRP